MSAAYAFVPGNLSVRSAGLMSILSVPSLPFSIWPFATSQSTKFFPSSAGHCGAPAAGLYALAR